MTVINDRTPNLQLALPNVLNKQTSDVPRLREALNSIDSLLHAVQQALAGKLDASALETLVNDAPTALNQLNELAAALGNDPNFATTILTALSNKLDAVPATAVTLGGVKVGAGLVVGPDGTVSVSGGGGGGSGLPAYLDLIMVPGSNGQTIFTVPGGYNPGQIDILLNGITLYGNGDDYTASNGTTFTLAEGADTTDTLLVRRWYYMPEANAVNKMGDRMTGALNWAAPNTLASAATVNIGTATSNVIYITGTTAITAFNAAPEGAERRVIFTGALTLTHNASSLILPTGANITTAPGDSAVFVSTGAGTWRCVAYTRANGRPLAVSTVPYLPISTNTAAVANTGYQITAVLDLTLPASPQDGDFIPVVNTGPQGSWVRRNGNNIGGLAEDMQVDSSAFTLIFRTGYGWMVRA